MTRAETRWPGLLFAEESEVFNRAGRMLPGGIWDWENAAPASNRKQAGRMI